MNYLILIFILLFSGCAANDHSLKVEVSIYSEDEVTSEILIEKSGEEASNADMTQDARIAAEGKLI